MARFDRIPTTATMRWHEDDADLEQAKAAINGHLERIELYRPLAQINAAEQQQQAAQVRHWYREVFTHVEMD